MLNKNASKVYQAQPLQIACDRWKEWERSLYPNSQKDTALSVSLRKSCLKSEQEKLFKSFVFLDTWYASGKVPSKVYNWVEHWDLSWSGGKWWNT